MKSNSSSSNRVLIPLGLGVALSLFGDLALYTALAAQLDSLHISLFQAGILLSIHRVLRIPGNPVAGMLMDRFGRRPLFLVGLVLAVISSAGYGLVSGFWPFLIFRLAWGAAWALINVGGMNMILDISDHASRGRLVGAYNIWTWAGYAVGPLAGGLLVDYLGFQQAMLVCAAFAALGLLIAFFSLPETRIPVSHSAELRSNWKDVRTAMTANRAIPSSLLLFAITQFAGDGVVLGTLTLLLQSRFPGTIALGSLSLGIATFSGALLTVRSVLAGLSGPLAGRFSDRYATRLPLVAGGLAAGILSFGLLAWGPGLVSVVAGVLIGAASSGTTLTALAAYLGDQTPSGLQGLVLGAYATAGDVGSASGPFLSFTLLPIIGLPVVYLFSAVIFLAGLGVVRARWLEQRGRSALVV